MKNLLSFLIFPSAVWAGADNLPSLDWSREDAKASGVIVEARGDSPRFRFGAGFAPLLNVDVEFSGIGSFQNPNVLQPLGGGQNYQYDDGFVGVDASGNLGGVTSLWGYTNNSQYDPSGTGSLNFSISNSTGTGRVDENEPYSPGFEIFGDILMGDVAGIEFDGRKAQWGIRGNLHYSRIDARNSAAVYSDVQRVTDTFPTNGVIPPLAPYTGSVAGPGPLIGDSPTRATGTIANGAFSNGVRELDVDLFGMGVGVFIEQEITERFSIGAEAGMNLAFASGEYRSRSVTTIAGLPAQTQDVEGNENEWLLGTHAGLSANYALTPAWSLYCAGRYQLYQDFGINGGSERGKISFGGSYVVSFGTVFNF